MGYLGNTPALSYTSFAVQHFTTSATTSYTLDYSVANENEIRLVINNVVQQPGSSYAYTASGTTLTLSAATSATDTMYAVFLGKAVQTVTPASGTVTGDMLSKPFNYDSGTLYLDDTNNRVGIGTTSPSFPLEVYGTVKAIGRNNLPALVVDGNSTNEGDIVVADSQALTFGHHTLDGNTGSFTERMRINSDGDVLFATTAIPNGTSVYGSAFEVFSDDRARLHMATSSTGARHIVRFYNPNGNVGRIETNGSATTYATSSDYRLKENVSYDFDATTRLKQLKPARFNFIADADTTVDGFLAHEVSSVVPEAVTGEKDAVNEDGSIKPQGIDQAKLVPVLTKALQEAITKIEELETRIQTLENN